MQEDLLRDIAIEIDELKTAFDKKLTELHRKLRIALGDVKERPKLTEFVSHDGKRSTKINRKRSK